MGKKSRRLRNNVKSMVRQLGYKEDELGELKPVVSKAEARERWLNSYVQQVKALIHAEEDAEFFAAMDRALQPLPGVGGPHGKESAPAT